MLESFVLIEPSPSILDRAGQLRPASLRALDAIHLATAISLDLLELEFIAYDERLAEAAAAHGLRTSRPS